MTGFGFTGEPMACCPQCGAWVPASDHAAGTHTCDREALIEYQVSRARRELTRIEWELASYRATPRARKLLAFRRFLEARDRRSAGRAA